MNLTMVRSVWAFLLPDERVAAKSALVTTLLAVMVILLLSACASVPPPSEAVKTSSAQISFWHDDARDVSCWTFRPHTRAAGISCIPDWQLEAP